MKFYFWTRAKTPETSFWNILARTICGSKKCALSVVKLRILKCGLKIQQKYFLKHSCNPEIFPIIKVWMWLDEEKKHGLDLVAFQEISWKRTQFFSMQENCMLFFSGDTHSFSTGFLTNGYIRSGSNEDSRITVSFVLSPRQRKNWTHQGAVLQQSWRYDIKNILGDFIKIILMGKLAKKNIISLPLPTISRDGVDSEFSICIYSLHEESLAFGLESHH